MLVFLFLRIHGFAYFLIFILFFRIDFYSLSYVASQGKNFTNKFLDNGLND